MSIEQFGYQMQEIGKIQQDWHQVSERMGEMTRKLEQIKATIVRATEIDLAASAFAGLPGFGAAIEVLRDAKKIASQAEALAQAKQTLTSGLAADAQKISAVIKEYEAIERKIVDSLKPRPVTPPAPPGPAPGGGKKPAPGGGTHSGGSGGGSHSGGGDSDPGGGGSGDAGSPGGKHDGGHLKDLSRGDWSTKYLYGAKGWEDWPSQNHPHRTNGHGEGVIKAPNLDGLSEDRKGIVERALERAEHKLGYSQSAETNGYRVDCSGLVSCAWGLPGPGLNTYGLMEPSVSHQIGKGDLQPGDAMIAGDHTLIFGGWANAAHTEYVGIEDSGSAGCVSHVIPYPYYHGDTSYHPYRRNGVQ